MSGVRMLHFLKDWWKFIQIHQYYTMALTLCSPSSTFGTSTRSPDLTFGTNTDAMHNELLKILLYCTNGHNGIVWSLVYKKNIH